MSELLTVAEAAALVRCAESTIRERINDRTRADAIPLHLIDRGPRVIRIHRAAFPLPAPTPIRPADLPYGGRQDAVDERVTTLVAKIRELQAAHLEVVTQNIRLQQELDLLRIERGVA
jgi:hypothetical protein